METFNYQYALERAAILVVLDKKGIIVHVNEPFCDVSQYEQVELVGKPYQGLLAHGLEDLSKTLQVGKVWQGETAKYAKNGTVFWVDETISPLNDDVTHPYFLSIQHDITHYKQMEKKYEQCSGIYRLIIVSSTDLTAIVDSNGDFCFVSPSFKKQGFEPAQSNNLFSLVSAKDRKNVEDSILTVSELKTAPEQLEVSLLKKDGATIDVEMTINPIADSLRSGQHNVVVFMRDITGRKENEQMIEHFAYHDTLTDLPNRRLFMKELRNEVHLVDKSSQQLAVMFLDIDRFKYINDYWGHEIGDLILAEAAKRIQESVRKQDIVARLGGDEFTVLMADTNVNEAKALAKHIRDQFLEPINVDGKDYSISCSIGIALLPEHAEDANELLNRADTALYYVKEHGGGKYAVFNIEMEAKSLERNLLENELMKAIEKEQFSIDYQPKVNLPKGTLIGMEALVRWHHPEIGRIPPNKFIPIAEETGLIIDIGEWVLMRGCMQTQQWQQNGFDSLTLSVNLSVRQLADDTFVDRLKNVLNKTGLDPKYLELEITESVFANIENAAHILQQIRELGVTISLDDFGTGYSSFSYIKDLPIDTLKIDASFIRDVHNNKQSQAIVTAILNVADTLGINVIAEGIEKQEQLNILNEDGCKQGQGFFFSKPLNSTDFERFIATYR